MATEVDSPASITFQAMVIDLSFHPSKDVIAAGDIDGDVTIHSYSVKEENHLLMTLNHHKKAVRAVHFSPSGDRLHTASKDRSIQIIDMDTGAVTLALKKAHDSPIYSITPINENMIASGDDDGVVKMWDVRHSHEIMSMKDHEDFISCLVADARKRVLIAASGDGSLSVYDIRKHELKVQSEMFDSELTSLAVMKQQKKLVCGTGEGALHIFNWDEFGNLSDRFPGHKSSIECMAPMSDDVVLTGTADGYIRAVNILPNKFIGVIGTHKKFPIENVSVSHCKRYVASCSHDEKIKFWNIEQVEAVADDVKHRQGNKNKQKGLNNATAPNNFFADMQEEDKVEEESKEGHEKDEEEEEEEVSEVDDTEGSVVEGNDQVADSDYDSVHSDDSKSDDD